MRVVYDEQVSKSMHRSQERYKVSRGKEGPNVEKTLLKTLPTGAVKSTLFKPGGKGQIPAPKGWTRSFCSPGEAAPPSGHVENCHFILIFAQGANFGHQSVPSLLRLHISACGPLLSVDSLASPSPAHPAVHPLSM